jgi:hypothetical protein
VNQAEDTYEMEAMWNNIAGGREMKVEDHTLGEHAKV